MKPASASVLHQSAASGVSNDSELAWANNALYVLQASSVSVSPRCCRTRPKQRLFYLRGKGSNEPRP